MSTAAEELREEREPGRGRGIALVVLGIGLFSVMDALVKWLGDSYPTFQLVFFRAVFAFIPLSFFLFRPNWKQTLRLRDPWGHVMRGVAGLISLSCFFYALTKMPLANVTAISFAAPIFVTALSVPLLGEAVGPRRWAACLVGFLGVLLMIQPGGGVFDPIALVALLATAGYALVLVSVRRLARTNSSTAIVLTYLVVSILATGVTLPFIWVTPTAEGWLLLVCLGIAGGLGQICVTAGYRHAEAAVLAPFDYTHLFWTLIFGLAFWGELPGNHIWIGVPIVVASGLYILYRETSLGLPRGVARRLQPRR